MACLGRPFFDGVMINEGGVRLISGELGVGGSLGSMGPEMGVLPKITTRPLWIVHGAIYIVVQTGEGQTRGYGRD